MRCLRCRLSWLHGNANISIISVYPVPDIELMRARRNGRMHICPDNNIPVSLYIVSGMVSDDRIGTARRIHSLCIDPDSRVKRATHIGEEGISSSRQISRTRGIFFERLISEGNIKVSRCILHKGSPAKGFIGVS